MRIFLLATLMVLLTVCPALAKVQSGEVEYTQGGTTLVGYLAYDDSFKGKRPGVLIIHEWNGLGPYVKARAQQLATYGYVAFAADIYGKGIRPATPQESAKVSGEYKKDRNLLRLRANAGLEYLRNQVMVDPTKLAAIGYCFGGTAALELARSGADLAGVVSFHGGLDSPTPQDAKNIKAKVLVLHGADDPNVPPAQVAAFQDEMRKGGVDWQLVYYGDAVHSFTNPEAGGDKSKGAAYNYAADKRSFQAMLDFFKEIFGN